MITRHFKILLIFLSVFTYMIAYSDGNIYVYRNDGKFNAFYSAEIDSLCYSNIGLDGTRFDHPVIQEIHTIDSLYRIPLAVIDSISVKKPETILETRVKMLYPDYVPYITGSKDLTIDLSTSLPYKMNLKKGDILFYDQFDDLFENGFAGRVISISNDGDLRVECEPVELSDVYKQFLGFGDAVAVNNVPLFKSPIKTNLDYGLDCNFTINPILRPLIYVKDGKTYIEINIGVSYDYNAGIHLGGEIEKEYDLGSGNIPIGQPIPGVLLTLGYRNFAELEASGEIDLGFYGGGKFMRTIVFENGTWNLGESKFSPEKNTFEGTISATGSISVGTGLTVGIGFVGKLFSADLNPSIGRCLEFEISKKFSDYNKNQFYDWIKESTFTSSNFDQLMITGHIGYGDKGKNFNLPFTGKRKFNTDKVYLLPEFSDLDIKTDNGSITVNSRASRKLFLPCKVGLAVIDGNGNEVDSYYEDSSVYLSDITLNKTFNKGLNTGTKYTVKPLVKLFNYEMYASPSEETYLDMEVTTGPAFATTYSVRTSGSFGECPSRDIEVGFVYSNNNLLPTVENASKAIGEINDELNIDGGFSGLKAGTTYYYRAYVYYNNTYYYGNTQCVTTKRNCDRSDKENIGGDYIKGIQPMASIGDSFDIKEETAKIELDFHNIHPCSTCSYHLEGDDKKGNRIASKNVSLGTVTGRNTIELDNLMPGTTYRFWCDIKGSYGNSVSPMGTFETTPSPDPYGMVTDLTDIEMESAKVTCKFDNIKKEFDCGLIISDGKWEYRKPMKPDESGMATINLTGLLAETTYTLKTYIITTYDPEPIEDTSPVNFTTEGPDITGWWIFNDNGQAYAGRPPYEINILASGKTDNFYGVNFLHWQRDGRNLYMSTPTYATQVGTSGPTACWEFFGRFNDDFTYCTGYIQYRNFLLDEVLISCNKPFTLIRKK